jgi:hypothetical protein
MFKKIVEMLYFQFQVRCEIQHYHYYIRTLKKLNTDLSESGVTELPV